MAEREKRSYVFLFIDSAVECTKLHRGRKRFGEVFQKAQQALSWIPKSSKNLWRKELDKTFGGFYQSKL